MEQYAIEGVKKSNENWIAHMTFFRRLSIRTKMYLIILAVGFPVVAAACFHFFVMYHTDYQKTEQAAVATAQSIASQYNNRVEGIRNLLTALSYFPEVRDKNSKACTAIIRKILLQSPSSMNIGIADLKGNLIASGSPVRHTIGDRKYFRDVLRSRRFSAGEFVISRAVGKPAINFAVPVPDLAGQPVAVLYATFDLHQFNEIFDSQKLPANSTLTLTDYKGTVLHHYPGQDALKPGIPDRPYLRGHVTGPDDEGVFVDYGPDGVKRLWAFKRLRLHPDEPPYMYVRVSTPEDSVLAGLNRYIVRSIALFALVALFAIGLNHFLVGRIFVFPIERMASVAGAVAKGDLTVRTGLQDSGAEIGLLAKSFDTMTDALDTRLRERLQAEEQIKSKEAQLRTLFDNLPFQLWAMNSNGCYVMQNSVSRACWGNYIGKKPDEAPVPKNFVQKWLGDNDRAFAGEVVKGEVEYAVDGEKSYFYNIIAPIKTDQSVIGIMGVNIDITERKSLESQLYQAQKMEAVGQLAGGIAHDFNNIVTAIIGYTHVLANKTAWDDSIHAYAGQIQSCAEHAAHVTRGLLAFSRKQVMQRQVVSLDEVVEQQHRMLKIFLGEKTDFALRLAGEGLSVLVDKGKMEQILMNLVVNARDAMPDGGSLVVGTSSMTMNDQFIKRHGFGVRGEYACISVSDTGCGMDPETMKKIFEPFFTTKEVGKGTGLGLAIVYGIVKQHDGFVTVDSEPRKGTTFRIYLPLTDAESDPAIRVNIAPRRDSPPPLESSQADPMHL